MSPRAFITGITGQDGSYLSELLLSRGYEVHGIVRRSSSFNTGRIDHIFDSLNLHHGDVTDAANISRLVAEIQPDEVYNLAAQSHVAVSFEVPDYTANASAIGALRLLEAVKTHAPEARFYQASTSEMFGGSPPPQSESTRFAPRSPYACAKLFAHHCVGNYREAYGLHASCGILFNHESPRRGETFVTAKVARAAAERRPVVLGNLEATRDWGHARDYVEAMWLMMQQDKPGDYVIATGQSHSVRECCEIAYSHVGLDWREFVTTDRRYVRPLEVDALRGDATEAGRTLGWRPRTSFAELICEMVDHYESSD